MAHWRNTFRPARFFLMDARAGVALLLFLLHIRLWTFILAVAVMLTFWWLERIGMNAASAFRAIRAWFAGPLRPARHAHKIRGRIDYDRRQV